MTRQAAASARGAGSGLLLGVAALCGGLLMALEILSSRILAPHFGNSVYVWGSIISVFLAALSIGYFWGGRLADRRPDALLLGRIILAAGLWMFLLRLASAPVTRMLADWTGATPLGTLAACLVMFGAPGLIFGMVSPFAIRLAADDVRRMGKISGRVYAVSTVGSLAGTLLCTFVAIPRWTVPTILVLLSAGTAATAALAMSRRSARDAILASLIAVAVLIQGGGANQALAGQGVVAVRGTAYQTLEIYDRAGVRYLRSDSVTQSAYWLDTGAIATIYVEYAPAVLLLTPKAERALAIGMGGGLLSKAWRRAAPEIVIDYVEIDPAVPDVAERYGFWRPDPADRVHIADGRRFLAQSDARWDVIYVDAYIGRSVPFHLTTGEFFALAKTRLSAGGTLALNLAAGLEDPFSRSLLHTLRQSFRTTLIFGVRGSGNVLLLASDEAQPTQDELRARAAGFSKESTRARLVEVTERFVTWEYEVGDVVKLSDAFAPAEHLVALGQRDFDLGPLASPTGGSDQP